MGWSATWNLLLKGIDKKRKVRGVYICIGPTEENWADSWVLYCFSIADHYWSRARVSAVGPSLNMKAFIFLPNQNSRRYKGSLAFAASWSFKAVALNAVRFSLLFYSSFSSWCRRKKENFLHTLLEWFLVLFLSDGGNKSFETPSAFFL